MNLLIEGFKNLGVNPASTEQMNALPVKHIIGFTGATKDDKAPIKSEWWDTMLYLGLSDQAHHAGSWWAKASRTIQPLVARHWRRMQLRK